MVTARPMPHGRFSAAFADRSPAERCAELARHSAEFQALLCRADLLSLWWGRVLRDEIELEDADALAGFGPVRRERTLPSRRRVGPLADAKARGDDPLLRIPAAEYVPALAGVEVRGTMARCPLPDHEDSTPSCHLTEELFFCHGCARGGSIYSLAGALWGLDTRGRDFLEIRERLSRELLGAAAVAS